MNTRIYVVKHATPDKIQEFLVDASSRQTAERHIAKRFISAQVANGRTVGHLMASGVKLEVANEVPAEQQELPVDMPADQPTIDIPPGLTGHDLGDPPADAQEGGKRRRRA